jgi:hypothetical protein
MASLTFDENKITIGDLEDFEDATGLTIEEALKPVPLQGDDGKPVRHNCETDDCDDDPCKDNGRPVMTVRMRPKVLKGLVWIATRHDQPDFTIEDARNVRVSELQIIRAGDGDDDGDDPKD